MRAEAPATVNRIWNRLRLVSNRAVDRARSLPLRLARHDLSLPPSRLMYLVSGTDGARWFLQGGRAAADSLRAILGRNGLALERCDAVLDFGCGVGRVIRHWSDLAASGLSLCGYDYNATLIDWCRGHLPFARFGVNGLEPGLSEPAARFDLIYAFSVFTHLTRSSQAAWMAELGRVLKPGGHLVISLHGAHYLPTLAPEARDRFRAGELVVVGGERQGRNACAAYHPEPYVREELARGWEVVDFVPEGAWGNPSQDLYLLRRP